MDSIQLKEFIEEYSDESHSKIAFAWNGLHADQFQDDNIDFRQDVIHYILANPVGVPTLLIRDLFSAEADFAKEAWCVDNSFQKLGELLLTYGGIEYINDFLSGYIACFDTYCACHMMELDLITLHAMQTGIDQRIHKTHDNQQMELYEVGKELFDKLRKGNAADGLVRLKPGTPVTGIRVVSKFELALRRIFRFFTDRK